MFDCGRIANDTLLKDILTKEENFNKKLFIVPELCSLSFNNFSEQDSSHLTALFRQNVKFAHGSEETCAVVAALFQKSPISGLPLIIEIMKASGISTPLQMREYFYQYADFLLEPYLRLYLLYGIALEGHQQNALAVFRHGKIKCFIAPNIIIIGVANLWCRLGDRAGHKKMLLRASIALVITQFLIGFSTQLWIILLLRLLQGFFAGFSIAAQAWSVRTIQEGQEGRVISSMQAAVAVGTVLGPLLGGSLQLI